MKMRVYYIYEASYDNKLICLKVISRFRFIKIKLNEVLNTRRNSAVFISLVPLDKKIWAYIQRGVLQDIKIDIFNNSIRWSDENKKRIVFLTSFGQAEQRLAPKTATKLNNQFLL